MVNKDDWRRRGQENYLMNIKLYHLSFTPFSNEWDHEHCDFCWEKFSLLESDAHQGYCTTKTNERKSIWICEQCFEDFKDEFHWEVVSG